MTYQEKLQHPKWQKKRLEILERDDFTCRICQSKDKTLHVHHGFYHKNTDPWDYDNDLLWTLCEICHEETEYHLYHLKYRLGHIPPEYLPHIKEYVLKQEAEIKRFNE